MNGVNPVRDYPFSTYANFSEKLILLTPKSFSKDLEYLLNE